MAMDAKDNGELNEHFDIEAVFFFEAEGGWRVRVGQNTRGTKPFWSRKRSCTAKQKKIGN